MCTVGAAHASGLQFDIAPVLPSGAGEPADGWYPPRPYVTVLLQPRQYRGAFFVAEKVSRASKAALGVRLHIMGILAGTSDLQGFVITGSPTAAIGQVLSNAGDINNDAIDAIVLGAFSASAG